MADVRMKLRLVTIQFGILCALLAGGPTDLPADESARASLAGRVVKEPGGEPIKKAVIELIREAAGESTHNYTATSDGEGNFEIHEILPGRYRILIERSGYVFVDARHHASDAAALSFERGQALSDQVFRMLPTAVVTGRVLDEDGDPMPGANVAVFRRRPGANGRTEEVSGERTNDLGQYRISGMMPGRYLIGVTPPTDFANVLAPHKNDAAKPDLAYVPTYYSNTTDRSQASPIDLRAGDEVPIDFSLARVPTARIRGTVANLTEGAHTVVVLHANDGSLVFSESEVGKDGKFEIRDVAPGSYNLMAIESIDDKARVARQTEQVAGANIDGVRLSPVPGATIHGQLRVAGSPIDFSKIALNLSPADEQHWEGIIGSLGGSNVKADGSFEWKDVPPGTYYITATGVEDRLTDYFVETVSAGAHDLRDAGLTISGGSVFLDVSLNSKGSKLEGVVLDDKDQPVANAVVVAMPEEKFRKRPDRFAKATTDQQGRFSMKGMIPGQYSVLSWESLEGDLYLDTDFLRSYEERAVTIRLEKGGQSRLSLKAQPAPED
jgi:hypothetical protein